MNTVGVRELRQNLSVYLARVKRGEALSVTERGEVVALLRPPQPASAGLVDKLVAEGRAQRPGRALTDLPRPVRLSQSTSASAEIINNRDDRF